MIAPMDEQSRCQMVYYEHPLDAYEVNVMHFQKFALPEGILGRKSEINQHCGFVQATTSAPLFQPHWGYDAGKLLLRPWSAPPTPDALPDSESDELGNDVEQCDDVANELKDTLEEFLKSRDQAHLDSNELCSK